MGPSINCDIGGQVAHSSVSQLALITQGCGGRRIANALIEEMRNDTLA